MSYPPLTPEERFAAIVDEFIGNPDVIPPSDIPESKRTFGSLALRFHKKIFAMLVKGKLVVKLPKSRVDALIASGDGERFDPRHDGRFMQEWVAVEPTAKEDWLVLVKEAMEFVGAKG